MTVRKLACGTGSDSHHHHPAPANSNKVYSPFILPHVWKFLSNFHMDHDILCSLQIIFFLNFKSYGLDEDLSIVHTGKLRTWEGKWVPKIAKQINGAGRRIWVSWLLIKHCLPHTLRFLAWVALHQNRAFDIKSLWDFFFPKSPTVTRNCGRKQTLKSKFGLV